MADQGDELNLDVLPYNEAASTPATSGLRYVVVEGPIGVGKTTLAKRLAQSLDGEVLLEAPNENPFLAKFYAEPKTFALPTQLSFLLQRARQLQNLAQLDLFSNVTVADFMVQKDYMFAELTLSTDELNLYAEVAEAVMPQCAPPDLVVYLQAQPKILMERLKLRGNNYEKNIDLAYLERLSEEYTQFFHYYDVAPLLIVNAAEIDFVNHDDDYQSLLKTILRTTSGRHYFNPLSLHAS